MLLNAATAKVEVDAPQLTSATQPHGTVSSAQTLRVFSSGDRALHVQDVRTLGSGGPDFLVASDTCSRRPIAPGTNCAVSVRFAPQVRGSRQATLGFSTNDPGNRTFAVALEGIGGDPPAGPAGAPGSLGTAGPTGATGSPGPAGSVGAPGADRELLAAALAADRHRAARGTRLRLRYVTTVAAAVTIELRRGRRIVTRSRRTAARGRNTIVLRLPRARGRYTLRLTAIAGSQRTTDRARVTVV